MNPLKCYRKNTFTILLDICDYEFQPEDMLYFTVKPKADSSEDDDTALIRESWAYSEDLLDENGTLRLTIAASNTDIEYGEYFYDIKIVSPENDGCKTTLITGTFEIMPVATLRV